MNKLQSINPFDLELLNEYPCHSESNIHQIIENATKAAKTWKKKSLEERIKPFHLLANKLLQNKQQLASLASLEMGKPILQSLGEIEKCAHSIIQLTQDLPIWLGDEISNFPDKKIVYTQQAKGVIALVMPWNFPYWQVLRCAAPAIMAGNTIILKHAPNVSGCSLAIEKLFLESGFQEGIFQSVLLKNEQAHWVLDHPNINGISLTGSSRAGSAVASIAGKNLIKSVLELGGSDPFIILPDMPIANMALKAAEARLPNNGQTCISGKRILISKGKTEEFLEELKKAMRLFPFGNPLEPTTKIGPLARIDLQQQLAAQVNRAVQQGSSLTNLLEAPAQGAFYEVQALYNQPNGSVGRKEELFGPVFSILEYSSEEELIEIANETEFGLGATIWTNDLEKANQLARQLEAGNVFINDLVKSDSRWPFGGIKNSGYGKELGKEGCREFCDAKIIAFNV